jgi:hypothetical protein
VEGLLGFFMPSATQTNKRGDRKVARIGLMCKGARGPFPDVLGIKRFAEFVSDFIEGCGFEPPLYLIAIGSNGSVAVSRHTDSDIKEVCSHSVGPGITSPIVVAVVSEDGRGKSAKIEIIDAACGRMQ